MIQGSFPFPDQQCKDAMRSMRTICAVLNKLSNTDEILYHIEYKFLKKLKTFQNGTNYADTLRSFLAQPNRMIYF